MTLDATDKYDIQRSFEVMDEDKTNRICVKNFHTMYLGLGFQPKQLTQQELRDKVTAAIDERKEQGVASTAEDLELFDADLEGDDSFIPLSIVLEILSQHSRHRAGEMEKCFQLVDSNAKGYITADDLLQLSKEAGEPIGLEEANALLSSAETDGIGFQRLDRQRFQRLFSPPSP